MLLLDVPLRLSGLLHLRLRLRRPRLIYKYSVGSALPGNSRQHRTVLKAEVQICVSVGLSTGRADLHTFRLTSRRSGKWTAILYGQHAKSATPLNTVKQRKLFAGWSEADPAAAAKSDVRRKRRSAAAANTLGLSRGNTSVRVAVKPHRPRLARLRRRSHI